jgi:hypothetical protein
LCCFASSSGWRSEVLGLDLLIFFFKVLGTMATSPKIFVN